MILPSDMRGMGIDDLTELFGNDGRTHARVTEPALVKADCALHAGPSATWRQLTEQGYHLAGWAVASAVRRAKSLPGAAAVHVLAA